jgi:hypothetical protein
MPHDHNYKTHPSYDSIQDMGYGLDKSILINLKWYHSKIYFVSWNDIVLNFFKKIKLNIIWVLTELQIDSLGQQGLNKSILT